MVVVVSFIVNRTLAPLHPYTEYIFSLKLYPFTSAHFVSEGTPLIVSVCQELSALLKYWGEGEGGPNLFLPS